MVLAVAIAAVLSHVCVLPHAHADEPAATTTHDHEPDGDAPDDDSIHGASCDVLRAAPTQLPVLDCTTARFAARVEPVVQLVNVDKFFGEKQVLRGVSALLESLRKLAPQHHLTVTA